MKLKDLPERGNESEVESNRNQSRACAPRRREAGPTNSSRTTKDQHVGTDGILVTSSAPMPLLRQRGLAFGCLAPANQVTHASR
jgi:hypothetical protein